MVTKSQTETDEKKDIIRQLIFSDNESIRDFMEGLRMLDEASTVNDLDNLIAECNCTENTYECDITNEMAIPSLGDSEIFSGRIYYIDKVSNRVVFLVVRREVRTTTRYPN